MGRVQQGHGDWYNCPEHEKCVRFKGSNYVLPKMAYECYRRMMNHFFPEEYPKDYEPWEELLWSEQEAWICVAAIVTSHQNPVPQ